MRPWREWGGGRRRKRKKKSRQARRRNKWLWARNAGSYQEMKKTSSMVTALPVP